MNCPNCGSIVNQGEVFCRTCGIKLVSQQVQPDYLQNQQNMETPNFDLYQRNFNRDEELINAYIGNNVDQLKKGDFSANTFFFGTFYIFYRKMWLLGLLWIVGSMIISLFLPSMSSVLTSAINIWISVNFKKWYLQHVKENVQKIKDENLGANHEQLMEICSKKGGTTIVPVVVILGFYIVIYSIFFTLLKGYVNENMAINNNDIEIGNKNLLTMSNEIDYFINL